VLRDAFTAHEGYEVDIQGDSFFADAAHAGDAYNVRCVPALSRA
jgi:hypothetical protein